MVDVVVGLMTTDRPFGIFPFSMRGVLSSLFPVLELTGLSFDDRRPKSIPENRMISTTIQSDEGQRKRGKGERRGVKAGPKSVGMNTING